MATTPNPNDEYDFGFSLVSEEELKKQEEHLKKEAEQQSQAIQIITSDYKNKIDNLMAAIIPFLENLAKDKEKQYIYWPQRTEKINIFIKHLNKIVDNS